MKKGISATELVAYTWCAHRASLAALGVRAEGISEDVELVRARGDEHESKVLAGLGGCVTVDRYQPDATLAAMKQGAPWIYHGFFAHGRLVGEPDFLKRVEVPSALGAFSYEPYDAKLGKHLKPEYVLQLCHYAELLGKVQGRVPASGGVFCGTGEVALVRLGDYLEYYRNLLDGFDAFLANQTPTEPYPVEACGLCGYQARCETWWEESDHLSRVLDIRRSQVNALTKLGIKTRAALSTWDPAAFRREKGLTAEGFKGLQRQAKVQIGGKLELRDPKVLQAMPKPGTGDLFFDMESDPYVGEHGLEYLFGFWVREGKQARFERFWAHSDAEEKLAFERTVDFMLGFREKHPDMHIYHYHSYEPKHMVDLSSRHGTREKELDDLLRSGFFVDLLPIVRKALVLPTQSRSLKAIEPLMGFDRGGELKAAAGSIVYYERWLESLDHKWLDDIELYNREDVRATAALFDWLRGLA